MSNRVLKYIPEAKVYYETLAKQYQPAQSNPALFLGPPVDRLEARYNRNGAGWKPISAPPCKSATDCEGRYSGDRQSGLMVVEALASTTAGHSENNAISLTGGIKFRQTSMEWSLSPRLPWETRWRPYHTVAIFPYVTTEIRWQADPSAGSCSGSLWFTLDVLDSKTGAPVGSGGGVHTLKTIGVSPGHGNYFGREVDSFEPYRTTIQGGGKPGSLYETGVSIQLDTWYEFVFSLVVSAGSSNRASISAKATALWSSPA